MIQCISSKQPVACTPMPPPATTAARRKLHGHGERGSVLMETVIAIPLFLVLIGGMFWLGELMLAKHKLVASDRFAAWNAGNRHGNGTGGIDAKLKENMFATDQVGDQEIAGIDYEN